MGYDRTAPKRAINVNLNGDLLRQADLLTHNLDDTLEALLAEFVAREEQRRRDEAAALDRVIASFARLHAEHGLLSDEFSAL